jgi:hypothetical protein
MVGVAVGWELYERTRNPLALGLVGLVEIVPVLLLALPAGHMADGAFWFDIKGGNFVSSTYYFADLPGWVKDFNAGKPADKLAGAVWLNHQLTSDLQKLYSALEASPFGNDLVEALAEQALAAEALGKREVTDILAVSFSSNDYVGHEYGPDSPEVHEVSLRTDALLEKLGMTDREWSSRGGASYADVEP